MYAMRQRGAVRYATGQTSTSHMPPCQGHLLEFGVDTRVMKVTKQMCQLQMPASVSERELRDAGV